MSKLQLSDIAAAIAKPTCQPTGNRFSGVVNAKEKARSSLSSMLASLLTARRVAVVWALVTSVSLLLHLYAGPWWRPRADIDSTSQSQTACLAGVVTVQPGGRLGNLVMEYASAAAVAQRHRLLLSVPSAIFNPLSDIFDNLTAQPLSLLLQQPPCRGLNLTEDELLFGESKRPPSGLSLEEQVRWARSRNQPVILRQCVVLPHDFASCLECFRQEFHFRAEIKSTANEKLNEIISETAQKTGFNKTQVCTVGVHVRRTDYVRYMRRRFHLQEEASVLYYKAASSAMLADLRSECAAVAFAVTSDDSQWCQRYLLPALTRNASEAAAASAWFLMASESPADDLCLLASCQHLIMAYGTFGLTAAILSGGRVIMYDTARHGVPQPPAAQVMASQVPNWRLVP